jgi:hypothetical protein
MDLGSVMAGKRQKGKNALYVLCPTTTQQQLKNIYEEQQLQIKHFFLSPRTLRYRVCVVPDRANG